jgi:hypothetical protein
MSRRVSAGAGAAMDLTPPPKGSSVTASREQSPERDFADVAFDLDRIQAQARQSERLRMS